MSIKIYRFSMGIGSCYFLQDDGVIMIDGGLPRKKKTFMKALEFFDIKPHELRLLVITHGHWDHLGTAAEIKEITGAHIAMHRNDKNCLEKVLKELPAGLTLWGKTMMMLDFAFKPFIRYPAVKVDVVLEDEDFSLSGYGISGRIIHTPGHTSGSVSVLLETGDVFVGDLAMNKFILRTGPNLPVVGDDLDLVKESWKRLLSKGAKIVHPAHGKSFSADIIRKALS